jgi:peptide/nickel transport system substrate-binding protein
MRVTRPIAALSAAALLALAGCGGGDSAERDSSGGASIDPEELGKGSTGQDPTAKGPVTIEGAEKGGTVHVLDQIRLTTTIDPTEAYYVDQGSMLTGLIVRSLTQYVYDEETKGQILVPDLATDLGRPNDDYTEWTFTIRDGVKWETGEPVTMEEIGWGIDRSFDRTTFPTGPSYSNDYFVNGDTFKGPYTDKKTKTCGCYEINGQDITIKMRQPFPDMPYWGAFPAIGPIPLGDASDPKTYSQRPLSTGPYKIDKYTKAKSLTLVRNDQWDPDSDPGRTAYPDSWDFKTQVQVAQIDQILLNDAGEAQTTLTREDVLASDLRQFQQKAPERLVLGPTSCTYYHAPDYRKVTDRRVREAIAWAYPYKASALAGGDIEGITSIPATAVMPPGTPGRVEYDPLPGHEPFQTDPEKARALLEEADALGYEIKFFWRTDSEINTKTKDVLVKALEEAGFTATPVPTTEAKYLEERDDINSPVNLRTNAGWCSDWPSGSSWFPVILESTDLKSEGFGQNFAAFSEKDVDDRIKKIQELPLDEQADAWGELDKYIAEKYFPIIPSFYTGVAEAHGSRVNGHFVDVVWAMPTYKNIWLTQS